MELVATALGQTIQPLIVGPRTGAAEPGKRAAVVDSVGWPYWLDGH
jgi:hypothetical protein